MAAGSRGYILTPIALTGHGKIGCVLAEGTAVLGQNSERAEPVFIDPFTSKKLLKKNWKCALRFSSSRSNTAYAMGIAGFVPSYDGEASDLPFCARIHPTFVSALSQHKGTTLFNQPSP